MTLRRGTGRKAAWLTGLELAGCGALLAVSLPGTASANSAAVDYFRNRADRTAVPALLSQDERSYYKDLFAAIEHQDWPRVQSLFQQKPDGPLHQVARAEYFLDAKSPRVELPALNDWLAQGVALPEAEQIVALASKRGATALPALPAVQPLGAAYASLMVTSFYRV